MFWVYFLRKFSPFGFGLKIPLFIRGIRIGSLRLGNIQLDNRLGHGEGSFGWINKSRHSLTEPHPDL
jgi:hypothetical protein